LEDIEKTMRSSSNNNDSNKQQMVPWCNATCSPY
jgi:hypothetical protein